MGYNSPKEIAEECFQFGLYKAKLSIPNFFVLAFLGGAYIAFGGLLSIIVAGGMPGVAASNPGLVKFAAGAMFPIGLIMVSVAGADLFTSDCAAVTMPTLHREMRVTTLIRVLCLSFLFNFLGTQFVAYVLTHCTGVLEADYYRDYLFKYVDHKMHANFGVVFLKGIGANWLVCMGTWMGFAGKDIISKSVGIWMPVMLFVTIGFEHSIANMFFIPTAIYSGAAITWCEFIVHNLLPATLGNIVGGGLFVGGAYWYLYLRK